jgi:hypothetical protein
MDLVQVPEGLPTWGVSVIKTGDSPVIADIGASIGRRLAV